MTGTVTAANSSKLNDGASAVILTTPEKAAQMGWKPLARIRGRCSSSVFGHGTPARAPPLKPV